MKILFLDDERVRHDAFDRENQAHEVHHAYNFSQFKKAIHAHRFDLVSFDHDLGTAEDGVTCAHHMLMALDARDMPARCVVHSWNPVGAQRLMALFRDHQVEAIRRPFACREEPIEIGETL